MAMNPELLAMSRIEKLLRQPNLSRDARMRIATWVAGIAASDLPTDKPRPDPRQQALPMSLSSSDLV